MSMIDYVNREVCRFLPWDSEHFGVRVARVEGHILYAQQTKEVMDWCQANKIDCLYFLAHASDAYTARVVHEFGFWLTDIRVTLMQKLWAWPSPGEDFPAFTVRPSCPDDMPTLEAIARTAYRDSRFYHDPWLNRDLCDDMYAIWIRRSCLENYVDYVLVAVDKQSGLPVGYITYDYYSLAQTGVIKLVGVAAEARGAGTGRALVEGALDGLGRSGARTVTVVTQGRNIAAQALYQKCGFWTCGVELWYHKWFEKEEAL